MQNLPQLSSSHTMCEPSTMSCCVVGLLLAWVLCARAHVRADAPARTRIFIRTRTHMCPSMGGVAVRTSPLTPSLVRSPLSPACPPLFGLPFCSLCFPAHSCLLATCAACCSCACCAARAWSCRMAWVVSVGLSFCVVPCVEGCVSVRVWCFVVPGLVASCAVRGVVVGV